MKKEFDPTKEICTSCNKNINLKQKHYTIVYNREKLERKIFAIEYEEPLAYFCTKKCFKEFILKHKIKTRKGL